MFGDSGIMDMRFSLCEAGNDGKDRDRIDEVIDIDFHSSKGGTLTGMKVDINNFVDAITILAVVACFAEGETHIHNAAIAKHKECDRIHCIATELRKMGATITGTDDGLLIKK